MFKYFCHGGPYHDAVLLLESPTTVVFTAKGLTGRYRSGSAHYGVRWGKPYYVYSPQDLESRFGHDLIWEQADV